MSEIDSPRKDSILFVDVGNSHIKAAYCVGDKWVLKKPSTLKDAASWVDGIKASSFNFRKIFVASVRKDINDLLKAKMSSSVLHVFSIDDLPSDTLQYATPATLGLDRYLVCLGAHELSGDAVVVIDAGSACTIDYMNAEGVYMGGLIMPGVESLLNIFQIKAPELPGVGFKIPSEWPGNSTKTSLEWGLAGFFMDGVEAAIQRFKDSNGSFKIYLTGGSAAAIHPLLSEDHIVETHLLFDGMRALISRSKALS